MSVGDALRRYARAKMRAALEAPVTDATRAELEAARAELEAAVAETDGETVRAQVRAVEMEHGW